jgi:hypothetical protein
MELKTFRYAAVPTLPLSGGKLKTVMASFFSSAEKERRIAASNVQELSSWDEWRMCNTSFQHETAPQDPSSNRVTPFLPSATAISTAPKPCMPCRRYRLTASYPYAFHHVLELLLIAPQMARAQMFTCSTTSTHA